MKKFLVMILATIALAGCGKSEAQEDYERCNDEYADGLECTAEEFKDYLYLEYENDAEIFGGADKATAETQQKVINEINDKVEEIFGE